MCIDKKEKKNESVVFKYLKTNRYYFVGAFQTYD